MTQTTPSEAENQRIRMLTAVPQRWLFRFLENLNKLAGFFVKINVSPNVISVLGVLAGAAAGLLFALRHPAWGAVFVILCGIFDILDGKVAVKANRKSLYGAIFDSALDRYSEFFIYLGLAIYFRGRWPLWIPFFTFLGSTMVSYTRARAEGLGIECKIGFMQRAERLVLLVLGAFVGSAFRVFDQAMIVVLITIALVSNMTAFQRILLVRKIENQGKREKEG